MFKNYLFFKILSILVFPAIFIILLVTFNLFFLGFKSPQFLLFGFLSLNMVLYFFNSVRFGQNFSRRLFSKTFLDLLKITSIISLLLTLYFIISSSYLVYQLSTTNKFQFLKTTFEPLGLDLINKKSQNTYSLINYLRTFLFIFGISMFFLLIHIIILLRNLKFFKNQD